MEPEGSLPVHKSPPYPTRLIQPIPSHPISLRPILILSTHLYLAPPSGLFPSGFPTNILYAFLFYPSHPPWLDHSICRRVQLWGDSLCSFLVSHHFISLQSKYVPQHPVLEHPQSVFLP
jgi:hypothetical protein